MTQISKHAELGLCIELEQDGDVSVVALLDGLPTARVFTSELDAKAPAPVVDAPAPVVDAAPVA